MLAVDACGFRWLSMAQPIFPQQDMIATPARRASSAIVVGVAALGAIALLGALALWFNYGTAVFFEMIASGISACF